jgi:hypothetical protein
MGGRVVRLGWLCGALVVAAWGCVEGGEERLGADGEVCRADGDCREPLLCIRQLCRAEEDELQLYQCDQVCAWLDQCGVESREVCQGECAEDTADWSAQEFNRFGRCLFGQSCEALRAAPEGCF